MSVSKESAINNIGIKLIAYQNCDDVQLFWRIKVDGQKDKEIPDCVGFQIERQRKDPDGNWGKTEILRNQVGFSTQQTTTVPEDSSYISRPSSIWPFQRYEWTDHGANSGETVKYRVVPVTFPKNGALGESILEPIVESDWTDEIQVRPWTKDGISAFFNRGFVISQFVARLARQNGWGPEDIVDRVRDLEEPLRRFLSGELRKALLDMLDEVIEDPRLSLYAALYELSDRELIDRMKLLHGRLHLVLANGSNKGGDGNEAARIELKQAEVDVYDRILGSRGFGHNKFCVVVLEDERKALKVWTGSTNWAPTGLCTQVNNGIMIEKEDVAGLYLQQWENLKNAQNLFPKWLVDNNSTSPHIIDNTSVWFTRVQKPKVTTEHGVDIKSLIDYVKGAKKSILYIMFQPGAEPLASILEKAKDPAMYVRGVVNSVIKSNEEYFGILGIDIKSKEYRTALVQPEGIATDFSTWVGEITRDQFMYPIKHPGIGHAITHSKIIVIDPLDEDCTVITGSHNFSKGASIENDDNFIVIRKNKPLAEAYAIACLATYAHYRWRAYVKDKMEKNEEIWQHLSDKPDWQSKYLTDHRKNHLDYWCNW